MFQPHDLLWLATAASLRTDKDIPSWVDEVFMKSLPVVVRRAPHKENFIPVGIRGAQRNLRFPAYVNTQDIIKIATPYDLINNIPNVKDSRQNLPALITLKKLQASLPKNIQWGITGSVGFELATNEPTITIHSDLDIVIKFTQDILNLGFVELQQYFLELPARCDVQIETLYGAVALLELAQNKDTILLKTNDGAFVIPKSKLGENI